MEIFVGAAVVGALLLVMSVRIVHQGWEFTVERFGRYTFSLKPGLHFLIPLVDSIGAKVSMMENVLDVPSQDVITKDNAAVTVDGVVFFRVMDAARSAYAVGDLRLAVMNLTMTNIRTVMGSMVLDDLLSHRETINAKLLAVVDEATNPWGLKVTRIEIKDIKPPRDLVDAMARQMKAEREKRAVILEAEGLRQAAILGAEGERQSNILSAEGIKQKMILEAEGRKESANRDAEARERLAVAEGKAVASVSAAIAKGSAQAVNYFVAQKYVEAINNMAKSDNQKLVLMPMETSGLVGSLAGLGAIVKDAFSGSGLAEGKADRKGASKARKVEEV